MGNTYSVPRRVKGESRILYIFSIKSLIYTIAFGMIGVIIYFLLNLIGLGKIGLVFVATFSIVGFGVGTLTIPDSRIVGNLRKAGGEQVSDILFRMLTFKKKKKIYLYKGGDE